MSLHDDCGPAFCSYQLIYTHEQRGSNVNNGETLPISMFAWVPYLIYISRLLLWLFIYAHTLICWSSCSIQTLRNEDLFLLMHNDMNSFNMFNPNHSVTVFSCNGDQMLLRVGRSIAQMLTGERGVHFLTSIVLNDQEAFVRR